MKNPLLGALVLALTGALAACSDSTSPAATVPVAYATCNTSPPIMTPPQVTLSFINTAPRYAGVALCVGSVQERDDQMFSTNYSSTYLPTSSVPQTVAVTATGDSTVLASAQVTFALDTQYTVVFTQHSTNGGLIVLPNTVSAPPLGDVSFRFVNTVPSVGAVDVYRTTGSTDLTGLTPLASNVAFETSSPYVSFPVGPTRFIVTAAGHPGTVVFEDVNTVNVGTDRSLIAGQAWTTILMYNAGNGLPDSLTTLGIKDRS